MVKLEHQDSIFHSLLLIFRGKLTGCFDVILPDTQIVKIWIYQGKIISTSSKYLSLKRILNRESELGIQKINLIFKEFQKPTTSVDPKPIGYYLETIYDVDSDIIDYIFNCQIATLKEVANLNVRYYFHPLESKHDFPLQEMTGYHQEIDDLLLDILNYELDLSEWYLDYPANCFCLELNPSNKFHIPKDKLNNLDCDVLDLADEKTTLNEISKLLDVPLRKVQKSAFILNSFGFVEYILSPRERAKFNKNLFNDGQIKDEIFSNKYRSKKKKSILISPVIFICTIMGVFWGIFQPLEFKIIDLFFTQHQEQKDSRITLVTIDDQDLDTIGKYPIPDGMIAQAINNLNVYEPRVIGLDMYRNLSIEPGTQELSEIFKNTANLIGVEKISEPPIKPNQILEQADQVSFADVIFDSDGFVRRALFSLEKDNVVKEAFGTSLAFIYLSYEEVDFALEGNNYYIGNAKISPLTESTGGYWKRSLGGYQMLINYRGGIDNFNKISLNDVLSNKFDSSLIKDKIIIIGSISDAEKDIFMTPESRKNQGIKATPGIVIHANHVSQLISASLEGRPLLNPRSKIEEIIFIFVVTIVIIVISFACLHILVKLDEIIPYWILYIAIPLLSIFGVIYLNYTLFLQGWWLPSISTIFSSSISAIALIDFLYKQSKNRIFFDPVTSLPNRDCFKLLLNKSLNSTLNEEKHLLVIEIDKFSEFHEKNSPLIINAVLKKISKIIFDTLENRDFACRYNQSVFMLYYTDKNSQEIAQLGEILEKKLDELAIPFEDSPSGLLQISSFTTLVNDI